MKRPIRVLWRLVVIAAVALVGSGVVHGAASTAVPWFVLVPGGGAMQSSGYAVNGSLGQTAVGPVVGVGPHLVEAGFWAGLVDPVMTPATPATAGPTHTAPPITSTATVTVTRTPFGSATASPTATGSISATRTAPPITSTATAASGSPTATRGVTATETARSSVTPSPTNEPSGTWIIHLPLAVQRFVLQAG